MLYDKYKLLQIAIPRTGSTGTYDCLHKIQPVVKPNLDIHTIVDGNEKGSPKFRYYKHGHVTFKEYQDFIKEYPEYKDYKSFSFVRNPYDRAVSIFHKIESVNIENETDENLQYRFRNFWEINSLPNSTLMNEWKTQSAYLVNHDGDVVLDFVGRVETFEEDWKELQKLNKDIPNYHRKYKGVQKTNRNDWERYYTDMCKGVVYSLFKEDFKRFGYKEDRL